MTGEEKQTIYNLLRTASRNLYGYTTKTFENAEFIPAEPQKVSAPEQAAPVTPVTPVNSAAPETPAAPVTPVQSQSPVTPVTSQAPATPVASNTQTASVSPANTAETKTENSGITLGDVILKIARCTHCALARTRSNVVPGTGVKKPDVLVIGDGPSREDNITGLPFSGPAGQLLDKMLGAIRLERASNCYLTNVTKCASPQNRDPYPEETEACSGYLEAQIKVLKPKMILCTGRVSAVTLLKNNQNVNLSLPVDQLHGKWFEYNSIPVFIIHNPEEVLRNPSLKKPVWDDLRIFAAKLKELSPAYAALFN